MFQEIWISFWRQESFSKSDRPSCRKVISGTVWSFTKLHVFSMTHPGRTALQVLLKLAKGSLQLQKTRAFRSGQHTAFGTNISTPVLSVTVQVLAALVRLLKGHVDVLSGLPKRTVANPSLTLGMKQILKLAKARFSGHQRIVDTIDRQQGRFHSF